MIYIKYGLYYSLFNLFCGLMSVGHTLQWINTRLRGNSYLLLAVSAEQDHKHQQQDDAHAHN